jgi:hypothetical protein
MRVNSESFSNNIDESDSQHAKQYEQRIWTWRGIVTDVIVNAKKPSWVTPRAAVSDGQKTDEGTMMWLPEPEPNLVAVTDPPEAQTLMRATSTQVSDILTNYKSSFWGIWMIGSCIAHCSPTVPHLTFRQWQRLSLLLRWVVWVMLASGERFHSSRTNRSGFAKTIGMGWFRNTRQCFRHNSTFSQCHKLSPGYFLPTADIFAKTKVNSEKKVPFCLYSPLFPTNQLADSLHRNKRYHLTKKWFVSVSHQSNLTLMTYDTFGREVKWRYSWLLVINSRIFAGFISFDYSLFDPSRLSTVV